MSRWIVRAAAAICTAGFGTNLLHYATYDSSYSHPYSFFLFAAFLDLTERWHQKPTWRTSLLLGLVGGLIILVRHTNASGRHVRRIDIRADRTRSDQRAVEVGEWKSMRP